MFKSLPLEVIEYLCFYVKVEDLVNVWDAIGMEGSESFWRKICKRQGYSKLPYENSLWKNVFIQNINWLTQSYVKRAYKWEPNILDSGQTGSSQNNVLLLGKHLVVNSCGKETLVWDLSGSPNLVQNLPTKCISHKGNKLLTYNLSEVTIYTYNTQTFSKLYEVPVQLPFNFQQFCSFTEDYLVTFDKNTSYLQIVDLRKLTKFSLMLSVTISRFFSLTLSKNVLFILTLEESNYKLKSFNLIEKIWLQDLVLFKCAALIGVPQIEISSKLIVSWSHRLEASGITPVKVFGLEGKYITSLPCSSCLEFNGTEIIRPFENILWMIVECDYLIFSTSKTTVSIWTPENLNYMKVVPKEDQLQNYGQKVVLSSLLVLSYSYCFKVIDFKKSVYLYEVLLGNQCSLGLNSFQSFKSFANEYYYIHFQYIEEDEDTNAKKMLPSASSLCFNYDSKNDKQKKFFVHIYDYTRTYSA